MQVSVVSVGLDKGIFLWDIRKDTPVRVVPDAHLHEITCVAINRAGTLIATGGADCAVKLWDFGSGRPVGMYAGAWMKHRFAVHGAVMIRHMILAPLTRWIW
jgi:WD40 repeat protein